MKAVIFDTETTGLPFHRNAKLELQPRIIEFGGLAINEHGEELATLNLIMDPKQPLEAIITKITGLTDDDLKGKPTFAEVLPQIQQLFEGADVVVAHNLPFDKSLIDFEMQRIGLEFVWPQIQLCTVQETLPEWGRRAKLLELYEKVTGVPLAQTHRALDDCRALAEIVIKENYIGLINSAVASAH